MMQEYIRTFLQYLGGERNCSPHTLASYEDDLRQFGQFLSKHFSDSLFSVSKIDHLTVRLWLHHLVDEGFSRRSIARKLACLKSFFRFLHKTKIIDVNPAANVQAPRLEKSLPTVLSEANITALMQQPDLSTPEGVRDQAILEMFYGTGIRLSELINLNWRDVSIADSTIKVMGKGSKQRIVPIGRQASFRAILRREKPSSTR
jgi:site-specific recombinase XerD